MDASILLRNLLEISQLIANLTPTGGRTSETLLKEMPTVICVDFLANNIRGDENTDFLQPAEWSWTKDSVPVGINKAQIICIQLERFLETEIDFNDALHCFLALLVIPHQKSMTVQEVLGMYPELNCFVAKEPGVQEFVGNYGAFPTSKKFRDEYNLWVRAEFALNASLSTAREEGMAAGMAAGKAEGLAEGRAEGRAEGKAEGKVEERKSLLGKFLAMGMSIQSISEVTGLSEDEIV